MPFVTEYTQLIQQVCYLGSSWRVADFKTGGQVISTVKYTDDIELLAKE